MSVIKQEMPYNLRQEVLEKLFLSPKEKSLQEDGKKEELRKTRRITPRTSRVHWSPDQGQYRKSTSHRNRLDSAPVIPEIPKALLPSDDSECLQAENKLVILPPIAHSKAAVHSLLLPAFDAYRLLDNRLVTNYNYGDDDDHDLKDLLKPVRIAKETAAITILETDVDGVVRIADDPDVADVQLKYQRYRCRRESVEQTARSNWILMQENNDMKKKHDKLWKRLQVSYETQIAQTHELLSRRLREIRGMCNTKCDAISIIPSLTESQRLLVEEFTETNSLDFREERKRNRTLIERFRNAGRMALIMVHGFNDSRRRYHQMDAMSKKPMKGNSSDIFVEVEYEKRAAITPGIAPELHMAFITQPENRSHKDITQILWVIKSSKAFMDLFPDDMEYELARRVSYERYDEGRVLAYQDRRPDIFYYVISGKLSLLTEYQLNTGTVTRVVSDMRKGSYSDLEELEKQWMRSNHLVAKGGVELLTLHCEDYFYLTKLNEGLPLDFLKTVDIFSEFPVEKFHEEPDSIHCKYYGRGQIVVTDSNRTPYIHVVKSGRMKVVRKQEILDIKSCKSYTKDAKNRPHDPLHTKLSIATHADAMLGPQYQQRKTKSKLNQLATRSKSVSPGPTYDSTDNACQSRGGSYMSSNFIQTTGTGLLSPRKRTTSKSVSIKVDSSYQSKERVRERRRSAYSFFSLPSIYSLKDIKNPDYQTSSAENSTLEESVRPTHVLPILINVPIRTVGEAMRPIERTWADPNLKAPELPKLVSTEMESGKVLPERETVLELDILKPKSVFGLDHLHEAKFSEAKGYTLLSDGVEVISISKRFFQHNANNNTMLQVETMFKDYMDSKEAREVLYRSSNWNQYRNNLLKQTLTSIRGKNCT